ncbi:hypothetical protein RQP46_002049 [Phenoliferia psychrophenolica]
MGFKLDPALDDDPIIEPLEVRKANAKVAVLEAQTALAKIAAEETLGAQGRKHKISYDPSASGSVPTKKAKGKGKEE